MSWPPAKNGWPRIAIVNLPAARCERGLEPALLRRIDRPQDAGVDRDEREAIGLDLEERRALKAGRDAVLPGAGAPPRRSDLSIRPSVVLVTRRSASTRARMLARAASGWRNVAAKPSSASYQSWLPGIA